MSAIIAADRGYRCTFGTVIYCVGHMRDMRLTDAQVAEVRRRRADPNRKLLSHAEALERLGRLGS